MTAVRPEHEGVYGDGDPHPRSETFRAAVDALSDPLNDPLPGEPPPQSPQSSQSPQPPQPPQQREEMRRPGETTQRPGETAGEAAERPRRDQEQVSPWFRPQRPVGPAHAAYEPAQQPAPAPASAQEPAAAYEPGPAPVRPADPARQPASGPVRQPAPVPEPEPASEPAFRGPWPDAVGPVQQARTAGRLAGPAHQAEGEEAGDDRLTVGLRRPDPAEFEGRAARRRAERERARRGGRGSRGSRGRNARGAHGGRGGHGGRGSQGSRGRGGRGSRAKGRGSAAPEPPPRPAGSRLEARRAERARREAPAIIASRVIGEVFISVGVLMLLFVAYQLWWTNVLAGQEAGGEADKLQDKWDGKVDPERRAGKFAPGEGFAIIHIPKIDVDTPIAQGVSKKQVLDKGMVGHYNQAPLKTAMPWDETGNFALAGHRNTHGEPFRYISRLIGGDEVVVETAEKYYTYKVTSRLPSTSPSNTSTIEPVPPQSGFTEPGRYITLTTCTPEFTSKYRLIVWGKMTDERPRSKGKPDALVE